MKKEDINTWCDAKMCVLEMLEAYNKRKLIPGFQFVLEVDGVAAFVVRLANRPKMTKESVYSPSVWEPITVLLVDLISPNAAQEFIEWLDFTHKNYQFEKKNFILKMLNGTGDLVEKWEAIGAIPSKVDIPLNIVWPRSATHESDKKSYIVFDIVVDKWNLLFLK